MTLDNKAVFGFLTIAFVALILSGLLALPAGNDACAASGDLPPTACDPEYMDALESRAWLEAQREITQNQNLISKPDSVLEYTCFNQFLSHLAQNFGDRLFSETSFFGDSPGIDSTTTDTALEEVVRKAMQNFIESNFHHDFSGDRLEGVNYDGHEEEVTPKGYNCDSMARVWEQARCLNFLGAGRDEKDGFVDFPWYGNNDPRDLPEGDGWMACGEGSAASALNTLYTEAMRSAFNQKQANFTLETDNHPFVDSTDYKEDDIKTHFDKILPDTTCSRSHYIKTGLKVKRGGSEYDEIVCTVPGCAQSTNGPSCGG